MCSFNTHVRDQSSTKLKWLFSALWTHPTVWTWTVTVWRKCYSGILMVPYLAQREQSSPTRRTSGTAIPGGVSVITVSQRSCWPDRMGREFQWTILHQIRVSENVIQRDPSIVDTGWSVEEVEVAAQDGSIWKLLTSLEAGAEMHGANWWWKSGFGIAWRQWPLLPLVLP